MAELDAPTVDDFLATFMDSGIPEIIAQMFPPEPRRSHFTTEDGSFNEEAFEDAHEDWRLECLDLAMHAAKLPELLVRLARAESMLDDIIDMTARHPTPDRPQRQHYPASIAESHFGARFDESAYARAFANWQTKLHQTVLVRDAVLERILASDTKREDLPSPDGTGRHRIEAPQTLLERGALLNDLFAQRDNDLEPPPSDPGTRRDDTGLSR